MIADSKPSIIFARINGTLELEKGADVTSYNLAAFNAQFEMNGIPTARFIVGVGVPANTEKAHLRTVYAHEFLNDNLYYRRVRAYLQIAGEFQPGMDWPEERFCIFHGRITGISLTHHLGQLSVMIQAVHWLADMQSTSILSARVAASSGAALMVPPMAFASGIVDGATEAGVKALSAVPLWSLDASDIWSMGIKPRMRTLASKSQFDTNVRVDPACVPLAGGVDAENQILLDLISDEPTGFPRFDDLYKANVPSLEMVEDIQNTDVIKGSISNTIQSGTADRSIGGATAWDVLTHFANLFQFSVIPTVETAVCAPVIGSLALPTLQGQETKAWQRTIKASEYTSFTASYPMTRLLRGLVFSGDHLASVSNLHAGGLMLGWGGCYLASEDTSIDEKLREQIKSGALDILRAPPWLDVSGIYDAWATKTTVPPTALIPPCQSMQSPGDTLSPQAGEDEDAATSDLETKQLLLGGRLCKTTYWNRHFLYRVGELTGKLRFDVSPGSLLRIEAIDGTLPQAENATATPGYLYGVVSAVYVTVNCLESTAHTSFSLAFLRTDAEKGYGVTEHPIYKTPWVGTVLQKIENVAELTSSKEGERADPF